MSEVIHKHYHNPFKSWHVFAMVIPSIVFVAILAISFQNKSEYTFFASPTPAPTPEPLIDIQIGETSIKARVADDELERKNGLSNTDSLPENEGMLFVFPQKDLSNLNFWMKDMNYPLDIIWINDDKVTQIDANVPTQPGVSDRELDFYIPNDPVDYVLEVNAGFSEKHDIEVGTEVLIDITDYRN